MGRTIEITWSHTEEALFELYKQTKDLDERKRYQTLWLLRKGKSVHETAEEVGVGYRTVQRWKNWYTDGGLNHLVERQHGGARSVNKWLTQPQRMELIAEMNRGRFQNFEEIQEYVQREFGVEYTISGVRSLFYRLGLRWFNRRKLTDIAAEAIARYKEQKTAPHPTVFEQEPKTTN